MAQEKNTTQRSQETWGLFLLWQLLALGKSLDLLGSVFLNYKYDKSAYLTDFKQGFVRIKNDDMFTHLTKSDAHVLFVRP